ncbi:MAG: DUF5678 domain-containing protein [Bryobacteraceae bacterium]
MTLTVTLSEQEHANIEAKAAARGVSVDAFVQDAVQNLGSAPPAAPKGDGQRSKVTRVKMKDRTEEMRWIREHSAEYVGKWIALDGSRLLAVGDDAKEVFEAARAAGVPDPLLHDVPPPGPFWAGWS